MHLAAILGCSCHGNGDTTMLWDLIRSSNISGLSLTSSNTGSVLSWVIAILSASDLRAAATVTPSPASFVRYSTTGALTYPAPRTKTFWEEEKSPSSFAAFFSLLKSAMYLNLSANFPFVVITDPATIGPIFFCSASSKSFSAEDLRISSTCGNSKLPKKSVASLGSCVGMLSIEQIKTPGPLNVFLSLLFSASYKQKGSSMEVHSFMNWIEPPGSAEISEMAISLLGS